MKVRACEVLDQLPPEWPEPLLPAIRDAVRESGQKIIVLDDDPTGTQTMHGISVLTEWSVESLTKMLAEPAAIAYILTNSRSLTSERAKELNRSIARNLLAAATIHAREFVVISRSDSTLRGHYPHETAAFIQSLERTFDATLIIPFFLEGGRLTIADTHYVREGEWLVPAAETEFANDASFGYANSNLRKWVSEKHAGQVSPEDVVSISIVDERQQGPEAIARKLEALSGGQICIVNAASYRDLEVFVTGLLKAEARGKRFFYRTAASFVRVRGGLEPRALLQSHEILSAGGSRCGGLVVAGSHVQKSSAQIEAAQMIADIRSLEVSVDKLLCDQKRQLETQRVICAANEALLAGKDTLIFTSRKLATSSDSAEALRIGNVISDSLVDIVKGISERPAWVIAKGGITSSDIATKALGVTRAEVLGQISAGVPVWLTGEDSRWPNLLYTVFPGNVGQTDTLAELIGTLRKGSLD
jgi:uncharacterized protein YgbK (DUF1537 family)